MYNKLLPRVDLTIYWFGLVFLFLICQGVCVCVYFKDYQVVKTKPCFLSFRKWCSYKVRKTWRRRPTQQASRHLALASYHHPHSFPSQFIFFVDWAVIACVNQLSSVPLQGKICPWGELSMHIDEKHFLGGGRLSCSVVVSAEKPSPHQPVCCESGCHIIFWGCFCDFRKSW